MRNRPMGDRPDGLELLELGRLLLLDELLPLLPPERHRELRLVATAIAIAGREAMAGDAAARDITWRMQAFYEDSGGAVGGAAAPHPSPLPASRERGGPAEREGEGQLAAENRLLRRLCADLRNGAFETCPSRERAARAILWRLTFARLREGNPQFLADNGFRANPGD